MALVFAILFLQYFPIEGTLYKFLFSLFLVIGAMLPDIDHPRSKIGQKYWMVSMFTKHRGAFHSIFLPLVFLVLAWIFVPQAMSAVLGLAVGYIAHLIGDAITVTGIRPFLPLTKFRIKGPVKTGRIFEFFIAVTIVLWVINKAII